MQLQIRSNKNNPTKDGRLRRLTTSCAAWKACRGPEVFCSRNGIHANIKYDQARTFSHPLCLQQWLNRGAPKPLPNQQCHARHHTRLCHDTRRPGGAPDNRIILLDHVIHPSAVLWTRGRPATCAALERTFLFLPMKPSPCNLCMNNSVSLSD